MTPSTRKALGVGAALVSAVGGLALWLLGVPPFGYESQAATPSASDGVRTVHIEIHWSWLLLLAIFVIGVLMAALPRRRGTNG